MCPWVPPGDWQPNTGGVGITSIRYQLDRLDSPVVPRSGQVVRFRAQWDDSNPGSHGGFPVAEIYLGTVHRISQRGSVFLQGFAGSTFGYNDNGIPQFFLGGAGELNAYGTDELRTNKYWLARLGYVHELFRLPPVLGNRVYAYTVYEIGKAYEVAQVHATQGGNIRRVGPIRLAADDQVPIEVRHNM